MSSRSARLLFCVFSLIALGLTPVDAQSKRGGKRSKDAALEASLRKKTLKVRREACQDLAKDVQWAARKGLSAEALELVKRIEEIDPTYEDLEEVKKTANASSDPDPEADVEALRKQLDGRVEKTRSRQAKRSYDFAAQCFKIGLFARAYELLNETCELAPTETDRNQKKARKILGYKWDKTDKAWITNWEADMKKKHFLTEEGWVSKKNRKKWDEGLREYKGKWVSVEEERKIRTRNEYNPFRVESENFEVLTNLGRKEAWEYANILEDFNRAFYAFFVGYYDPKKGAKLIFKKEKLKKKHKVYIFPSILDYRNHVKMEHGNRQLLRESAGFYSFQERISRFYWSEDRTSTFRTLFHEVAHQLFAETKEDRTGGSTGNNWVVEGIASYVETWDKVQGKWYPGRNTSIDRMQQAKEFLAASDQWRLKWFASIDSLKFHRENRGLNYAVSCALCHFFLHYEDEVYREKFMRFVSDYYGGKVRQESLVEYFEFDEAESVDEKFLALEKQFRSYMAGLPESSS